ncbi:MAG: nicotinamide-nucleotide amidohydrolase family protein [Treponema sp.]|jgi:PncC family amidohydrolase|nr:nicotinamide-nucleotide amidohydrolase family protein [Treponema sp.]
MDPAENSTICGQAEAAARRLVETLARRSQTMTAAESCTAGLTADLVARIPGASRVLWGAFVTYTVDAKVRMLGLDPRNLEKFGPVSRETACAMALGALDKSGADYAVAVTGLAGPGGDGTQVPVGTVWIAAAGRGRAPQAHVFHFEGSRNGIRERAAREALEVILKQIVLGENNGNELPSPA